MTDYVKEFWTLQKSGKIRVADFCRERMLDYYEMVEALKKDKFLSELPEEQVVAAELEITDLPCDHPESKATYYSGESQVDVGQQPAEKTDGGKGYYAY